MISKEQIEEKIKKEDEGTALDYKEDLILEQDGDKAEFIKDIVSLANSSKISYIIIGVQDKTKKLVGLKTSHTTEQLNDILKNKCDPPISLEYIEEEILGHSVGAIEINGENPPYIISVADKFGGKRSSGESCNICRGTIFIRNNNKNEGAVRAHIDKIYENTVKYVFTQADLQLKHKVSITHKENYKEVQIQYLLKNVGDVAAANSGIVTSYFNIQKLMKYPPNWKDDSNLNPYPSVSYHCPIPVLSNLLCGEVIVQVEKDLKQIDTNVALFSSNMRTKAFKYYIPLDS